MPVADRRALVSRLASTVVGCTSIDPNDGSFDIDGIRPAAVCEPGSPEELAAALALAHREGGSVIPWGGGTRMAVGFPPRFADVVIRTTGLSQVVEYEPADLTVTVQAGMSFGALQSLLAQHNQMLALDPPAADRATIGGVVASGASGPMRLLYGTARDLVIGTRVANADGTLTKAGGRVVKNVAGYDLNKLYAGSYGTAGIIVELSFKLHPLPPARGTVVAVFRSPAEGQAAVQRLVRSPLSPAAVELLDASVVSDLLGLTVPEGGIGFAALVVGFERAVARQVRDIEAVCVAASAVTELSEGSADEFWQGVRAFVDLTYHPEDEVLKVGVPPAQSAEALVRAHSIARALDLRVKVLAHAGTGVVYVRVDPSSGWDAAGHDALVDLIQQMRQYTSALRGSLIVESCPVVVKERVDVWGNVGSTFHIMAAIKQQFDPDGVLNPGRFVGRL